MTSATGSKPSGFTLLELVLVMTTIAILGAVAMPKFSATAAGLGMERAAAEVAQLLRVAQADAVTGARTVECRYEEGDRRFVLQPSSRRSHALPAGAQVEWLGPGAEAGVFFYPNGTSSGSIVVFTMGPHVHHLSIDPLTSLVRLRAGRPAAR